VADNQIHVRYRMVFSHFSSEDRCILFELSYNSNEHRSTPRIQLGYTLLGTGLCWCSLLPSPTIAPK
jgi:hypothetical protein